MSKKVKIDAWQKFQNPLLTQYNIEQLAELKRSNWSGLLLGIDQLYATMYHEWDALQKDVNDIAGAVRTLEWTVTPHVRDGEEADEYAQQVADVVNEALWKRARVPLGGYSHSFLQLVESMVHAVFRGYNVHQIEWVNDGQIVYPGRYIQLYPQFLIWETQSGKPDRLLLVPDGQSGQGVPFADDMFIVALNNNGPDHPVYNATFYSLVNWFLAYKFGLGWFMQFAQKYGMPKQVFRYGSEREKEALINEMEDDRVLNSIFLKGDRQYEIINPPQGGASMPQAVLVQKAEEACHKAILGQTLTSDTSSHGGSLAQAKVHAGVRSELVLQKAEFVCEILNQQLIPAIVRLNFGRSEGMPLPELRCKLPQEQHTADVLNYWKTVKEMGVPFKKSEFHDSTGISMPSESDEIYGGEQQQGAIPGMEGEATPQGNEDDDDDPEPPGGGGGSSSDSVAAAKQEKIDAAQAWLAPLKETLKAARARGASLADIAKEAKEWRLNTVALAQSMAENVKRGLLGEASSEEVKAENPYGCNQYGEGWAMEHNGNSTARMGDKKLITHRDEKGNIRQKQTSDKKPRKGEYEGVADEKDGAKKTKEKHPVGQATTREEAIEHARSLLPEDRRKKAEVHFDASITLHQINAFNLALSELVNKYPTPYLRKIGSNYVSNGGVLAFASPTSLEMNHDSEKNGIKAVGKLHKIPYYGEPGFKRELIASSQQQEKQMKAVITHEYGHVVFTNIKEEARNDDNKNYETFKEARNAVRAAYRKARKTGFIKNISSYANTDEDEFFCECFSAREMGEKLPDYINNALDKALKISNVK